MNYKLLAVGTPDVVNIGDYVQALASKQFLPSFDGFIEREELKDYTDEGCKIIMNGWYMHNPTKWPPSSRIIPLFVAFHINSLARDVLLDENSINYLKKYEPIGCRDTYTRDMLKEKGIKAYFSGCMTLTLGCNYTNNNKEDKVYFVDPYFPTKKDAISIIDNVIFLLKYWSDISKIAKKYPSTKISLLLKIKLATFYREYRKLFTRETLLNAEYICQESLVYKTDFPDNNSRLQEAERLVKKYAAAKLVVTSRIHCALPCLGLETPVIYVENYNQSEASKCRFGGIRELFNIVCWKNGRLEPEFHHNGLLSITNVIENKKNWKTLAKGLIDTCRKFTSN